MEKNIMDKVHQTEVEIFDVIVDICKKEKIEYFMYGGTLLGAINYKGFIPWDDDIDIVMPRDDFEKFIKVAPNYLNEKFKLDYITTNKNYYLPFAKVRNVLTSYDEKNLVKYFGNKGMWVDIIPLDYSSNLSLEKIHKIAKRSRNICNLIAVKNLKLSNANPIKIFILKFIPNKLLYFLNNKIIVKKNEGDYYINYATNKIKREITNKNLFYPLIKLEFCGKKYFAPNKPHDFLLQLYGPDYPKLPPIEKRITHNPVRIKFEDGEEIFPEEN